MFYTLKNIYIYIFNEADIYVVKQQFVYDRYQKISRVITHWGSLYAIKHVHCVFYSRCLPKCARDNGNPSVLWAICRVSSSRRTIREHYTRLSLLKQHYGVICLDPFRRRMFPILEATPKLHCQRL